MSTIEFKFSVGDRVLLKEIQQPGIVDILQVDHMGIQYRVAYWYNCDRKIAWLYVDEIEPR